MISPFGIMPLRHLRMCYETPISCRYLDVAYKISHAMGSSAAAAKAISYQNLDAYKDDYTQLLDRYNSILTRNTALYALQNLKHVNQNVLFMRLSVTDCFDCCWWGIICCFSNDFDFEVGRLFVPSFVIRAVCCCK